MEWALTGPCAASRRDVPIVTLVYLAGVPGSAFLQRATSIVEELLLMAVCILRYPGPFTEKKTCMEALEIILHWPYEDTRLPSRLACRRMLPEDRLGVLVVELHFVLAFGESGSDLSLPAVYFTIATSAKVNIRSVVIKWSWK